MLLEYVIGNIPRNIISMRGAKGNKSLGNVSTDISDTTVEERNVAFNSEIAINSILY